MATESEPVHTQAHLFEKSTALGVRPLPCQDLDAAQVATAIRTRGWAFLKVSGKSMFPWIRERDIVFLRRVAMDSIRRGDVIVFERNSTLRVHRVLSLISDPTAPPDGLALVTKGDATADADAPVLADEFHGKVEFIYRRNHEIQIARGWRKYFGKLLAVISPAVRWWRPVATLSGDAARCELDVGMPPIQLHRSSDNSAD